MASFSDFASGLASGVGRGVLALGTGGISELARSERQQKQQQQQQALERLAQIQSGQNIPNFRRDELQAEGVPIQQEIQGNLQGEFLRNPLTQGAALKQLQKQAFPEKQSPVTLSETQRLADPTTGAFITEGFTSPKTQGQQALDRREFAAQREDKEREFAQKTLEQSGILTPLQRKKFGVSGFDLTGEIIPDITEVKDFRKLNTSQGAIKNSLEKIREIIKNKGGELFSDRDTNKAKRLARLIQLEAKGPLFELGVLAGPDLDILNAIIPEDPTEFRLVFNNEERLLNKFKEFTDFIDDKVAAKGSALGYTPKAGEGAKTPTPEGLTSLSDEQLLQLMVGAE